MRQFFFFSLITLPQNPSIYYYFFYILSLFLYSLLTIPRSPHVPLHFLTLHTRPCLPVSLRFPRHFPSVVTCPLLLYMSNCTLPLFHIPVSTCPHAPFFPLRSPLYSVLCLHVFFFLSFSLPFPHTPLPSFHLAGPFSPFFSRPPAIHSVLCALCPQQPHKGPPEA